jgi:hypothetical protein
MCLFFFVIKENNFLSSVGLYVILIWFFLKLKDTIQDLKFQKVVLLRKLNVFSQLTLFASVVFNWFDLFVFSLSFMHFGPFRPNKSYKHNFIEMESIPVESHKT